MVRRRRPSSVSLGTRVLDAVTFALMTAGAVYVLGYFAGIWSDQALR